MEEKKAVPTEKVDFWLKLVIVVILVVVLVLGWLVVGGVFGKRGAPRTAIERELYRWQDKVKENPSDYKAHVNLGSVYFEMGQVDNAIAEYEIALRMKDKYADAHFYLGEAYKKQGKTDQAIDEFKKATKYDPKHAGAYFELGLVYLKKNNYKQAIDALTKSREAQPMAADTLYYLGLAYEKDGQKDQAIKMYQEALTYIPDYKEAQKALERLK